MVPRHMIGPVPLGFARVEARDRCRNCYLKAWYAGLVRRTRPAADVLEDTAILSQRGLRRAEIAERLGLKPDSLYQVHRRAGVPCPV